MSNSLLQAKVLVTREETQAKAFSKLIAVHNGIPVEVPLLHIQCTDYPENEPIWGRLSSYTWLFFTSANGVNCFLNQMKLKDIPISYLYNKKIAAVGHKTENELKLKNIQADFIPTVYDADTMASEFMAKYPTETGPFLLIRGNRSRDILPVVFAETEISYDSLEVYETTVNVYAADLLKQTLKTTVFDYITFTSPTSIEYFMEFKGTQYLSNSQQIVCIGTTTEKKAREFGFQHILVPTEFTIEGMIKVMIEDVKIGG